MVLNPSKCCYISFGSNHDKSDLILENSTKVPSAEEYVVLRVAIDNRLTSNKTYIHFLRDTLAIALLFGHFVLRVQIILLTNFMNKH